MKLAEKKIIDEIDALAEDIVDFGQRLIAQPSTLRNEAEVLEVIGGELQKLALKPVRVTIDVEALS